MKTARSERLNRRRATDFTREGHLPRGWCRDFLSKEVAMSSLLAKRTVATALALGWIQVGLGSRALLAEETEYALARFRLIAPLLLLAGRRHHEHLFEVVPIGVVLR